MYVQISESDAKSESRVEMFANTAENIDVVTVEIIWLHAFIKLFISRQMYRIFQMLLSMK